MEQAAFVSLYVFFVLFVIGFLFIGVRKLLEELLDVRIQIQELNRLVNLNSETLEEHKHSILQLKERMSRLERKDCSGI